MERVHTKKKKIHIFEFSQKIRNLTDLLGLCFHLTLNGQNKVAASLLARGQLCSLPSSLLHSLTLLAPQWGYTCILWSAWWFNLFYVLCLVINRLTVDWFGSAIIGLCFRWWSKLLANSTWNSLLHRSNGQCPIMNEWRYFIFSLVIYLLIIHFLNRDSNLSETLLKVKTLLFYLFLGLMFAKLVFLISFLWTKNPSQKSRPPATEWSLGWQQNSLQEYNLLHGCWSLAIWVSGKIG